MTVDAGADRPGQRLAVRPDVLAYPKPTTVHLALLVLAVVGSGLFVGSWIHNVVLGDEWFAVVLSCEVVMGQPSEAAGSLTEALTKQELVEDCTAPAQRRLAAYAIAGAAATAIGGCVLMLVVPAVIERRRGLRPLPAALEPTRSRVADLAAEAGLRRLPEVLLGRATQRDAFTYGTPGRYRIALPPKVALRPGDAAVFDPVVAHELAHIAHRDVALAWFARSVQFAFLPVLAVPVVLSLVGRDLSVVVPYAWRAALVLATVWLVGVALLRSREHDADLAAGRSDDRRQALRGLLATMALRQTGASPAVGVRRLTGRALSYHPGAAERVAVLDDPVLVSRPAVVDAATAAFLAAATAPGVEAVAVAALTSTGRIDLARPVTALATGAPLGMILALGLWRAALYQPWDGRPSRAGTIGLAAAVGALVGGIASPVQTAAGPELGGGASPEVLLLPLAVLGATALLAGLGALWADAAPRFRSARVHWSVSLGVGSVVMSGALLAADLLGDALAWVGWQFALAALASSAAVPALVAAVLLAAVALTPVLLRRGGSSAPAWSVLDTHLPVWPTLRRPCAADGLLLGALGGLVGAAVIVVFRLVDGPGDWEENSARAYAYVLVAAAAAMSSSIGLAVAWGVRGAAMGLVAAPLAAFLTGAGYVAFNTVLGGAVFLDFVLWFAGRPVAVALVLCLLTAAAALLVRPPRADRRPRRRALVSVLVCLLLTVGLSAAVLVSRSDLWGAPGDDAAAEALRRAEDEVAAMLYVEVVGRQMADGFAASAAAVDSIDADPSLSAAEVSDRIRATVEPPLRDVLSVAEGYHPTNDAVAELHSGGTAAAQRLLAGLEQYATAAELGDEVGLTEARSTIQEGAELREQWFVEMFELRGDS